MKQLAAILVLQYWYTILVIPVFNQYLPVSAILVQILVNTSYPVSSRIFQYLQYNLPVSAILVLLVFSRFFQYLQYWYYQYFPESSSIYNTGITSISQNLPVSTILIFWQ
jgi:hypothetical protein